MSLLAAYVNFAVAVPYGILPFAKKFKFTKTKITQKENAVRHFRLVNFCCVKKIMEQMERKCCEVPAIEGTASPWS